MKVLDRYIIRLFLVNFVLLLVVLLSIFALIDFIADVDEFLKAGRMRAERSGRSVLWETLLAVGGYYGPTITLLYVYFSGLIVVGAMGFTLTQMQRHRELTALMGSGISLYRVAAPVLVAGFALNLATLPVQELLLPELAPALLRRKSRLADERVTTFPVSFTRDRDNNLLYAAAYDPTPGSEELRHVQVLERGERAVANTRLTAERATWTRQDDVPGWSLEGGERVFSSMGEDAMARPPERVTFYPSDISPDVLLARRASIYPRLLPLAELQRMQANPVLGPARRRSLTKIIWSRLSLVVLNALVLVMAVPFFLGREPKPVLWQSVKAAAAVLGAWGVGLVLMQVSGESMNPVLAAWLPIAVYLPIAAAGLTAVET